MTWVGVHGADHHRVRCYVVCHGYMVMGQKLCMVLISGLG